MSRITFALILSGLVCATSFAQEREGNRERPERESDQRRPEAKEREGRNGRERAGREREGDRRDSPEARQKRDSPEAGRKRDSPEAAQRRRSAEAQGRARRTVVRYPSDFNQDKDNPVFSGPQKGEKLTSFKAISIAGDNKGKNVDVIKDAGDKRHVLIFQDDNRATIRGLFGVVQSLAKIRKQTKHDLKITSVFLSDDTEEITQMVSRFGANLQRMGVDNIAVSTDGRDGPGSYGLNRNIGQTFILANGNKVVHNFAFPQGTLQADSFVLGGIGELIGEKPGTIANWVDAPSETDRGSKTRMDARRDPQVDGRIRLRTKLSELVRAGKIDRTEASEVFEAAFPGQRDAARDSDRPRGDRDRPRDGDRARRESDRPRDGDRPRGERDRPREGRERDKAEQDRAN